MAAGLAKILQKLEENHLTPGEVLLTTISALCIKGLLIFQFFAIITFVGKIDCYRAPTSKPNFTTDKPPNIPWNIYILKAFPQEPHLHT